MAEYQPYRVDVNLREDVLPIVYRVFANSVIEAEEIALAKVMTELSISGESESEPDLQYDGVLGLPE